MGRSGTYIYTPVPRGFSSNVSSRYALGVPSGGCASCRLAFLVLFSSYREWSCFWWGLACRSKQKKSPEDFGDLRGFGCRAGVTFRNLAYFTRPSELGYSLPWKTYTLNDLPHPQPPVELGFETSNPVRSRPSWNSRVAPSRRGADFGSTITTRPPGYSQTKSSSLRRSNFREFLSPEHPPPVMAIRRPSLVDACSLLRRNACAWAFSVSFTISSIVISIFSLLEELPGLF